MSRILMQEQDEDYELLIVLKKQFLSNSEKMDEYLCGYVGVPEGHPLYGQHHSKDELAKDELGGIITWSGRYFTTENRWFFGFDNYGYDPSIVDTMSDLLQLFYQLKRMV